MSTRKNVVGAALDASVAGNVSVSALNHAVVDTRTFMLFYNSGRRFLSSTSDLTYRRSVVTDEQRVDLLNLRSDGAKNDALTEKKHPDHGQVVVIDYDYFKGVLTGVWNVADVVAVKKRDPKEFPKEFPTKNDLIKGKEALNEALDKWIGKRTPVPTWRAMWRKFVYVVTMKRTLIVAWNQAIDRIWIVVGIIFANIWMNFITVHVESIFVTKTDTAASLQQGITNAVVTSMAIGVIIAIIYESPRAYRRCFRSKHRELQRIRYAYIGEMDREVYPDVYTYDDEYNSDGDDDGDDPDAYKLRLHIIEHVEGVVERENKKRRSDAARRKKDKDDVDSRKNKLPSTTSARSTEPTSGFARRRPVGGRFLDGSDFNGGPQRVAPHGDYV